MKKNGQKCHPEINEFVIHSFNDSMRELNLALDQMPPTFTDMPLKCVPLPFFDIRNSVVVALVLCSFHLLIRDILLFKFQHLLSPLSKI